MAQSFYQWRRNLEESFAKLRNVEVPIKMEVGNTPDLHFTDVLIDFAKYYMERQFVQQFVLPAYKAMNLPNAPYPYMPHIEIGAGASGRTTYKRHQGHLRKNRREAAYEDFYEISQEIDSIDMRRRGAKDQYERLTKEKSRIIERIQKAQATELKSNRAFADEARNDPQTVIALWQSGFQQMLDIMTTVGKPRVAGNDVIVSMGSIQKLLTMKLGSYSVTSGRSSPSKLDSFFYAAEFGTGISQNVGGRVNTEGRTKTTLNGAPGYWWFGNKGANGDWHGGLFSGQRGTHFLFQAGTDTPNPRIKEYIGSTIQSALKDFFRNRRG